PASYGHGGPAGDTSVRGHQFEETGGGQASDPAGGGRGGRGRGGGSGEDGKFFNVPQFTRTITLTPEQQAILDAERQLQLGLLGFGQDQLDRLTGVLSEPFNLEGLPPDVRRIAENFSRRVRSPFTQG